MNMKTKFSLSTCIAGLFILLLPLFSNAQNVFVVTDSIDSNNPGSLRYAITQANAASGSSIIKFNIPSPGTNPIDLPLNSTLAYLPVITKTVIIDGTTQPGASLANSRIRIIGSQPATAAFPTGIVFNNAPGSKLLAIRLWGFTSGVLIQFSDNCEIRNCSVNRCVTTTIGLTGSSYCVIKGTNVNTDHTGSNLNPPGGSTSNAEEGIILSNGCKHNVIGGQACDEGNTIAYTTSEGIDNYPGETTNIGNIFSGNKIYGNANAAIFLRSAANGNIQPPTITTVSGKANCVLSGTITTLFGIVEVFSADSAATTNKCARAFLGSTTANASGAWVISLGVVPAVGITATVRDPVTNNTSQLANAVSIDKTVVTLPVPPGGPFCLGKEITFVPSITNGCSPKMLWNYFDSPLTENPTHIYSKTGSNAALLYAYTPSGCVFMNGRATVVIGPPCPPPCEGCIGSFAPEPGTYVISAWVKKETPAATDIIYTTPRITISFPPTATSFSFTTSDTNRIIDGWQRIERQFSVPSSGVTSIKIDLECLSGTGNCLFDDIRIFPYDGSMKSYVYDPATKKLVAELDERNYSTFYEYDEEGKLIRVKKETEKGIMTIKENRDNTNKRQP